MQVSFSRISSAVFVQGEWLCVQVVIGDVALDGVFQVGNRFEDT